MLQMDFGVMTTHNNNSLNIILHFRKLLKHKPLALLLNNPLSITSMCANDKWVDA